MVHRPLVSVAVIAAVAVATSGCVQFSSERRADRYSSGFSADEVVESTNALQNTALVPSDPVKPSKVTAIISQRKGGKLVVCWGPPEVGAAGAKYKIRISKTGKPGRYQGWKQTGHKRKAKLKTASPNKVSIQIQATNKVGAGPVATYRAGTAQIKYKNSKKVKKVKGARKGKPRLFNF